MMSTMAVMGLPGAFPGFRRGFYRIDNGRLSCPAAWQAGRTGTRMAKTTASMLGQPSRLPASPDEAVLDRVPNPHADTDYLARFTAPGIHLALPGHRPAGFRASRDRLRAGQLAGRVEVAEALSRQLPQPRRLPRGLHGRHRQAARRRCSSRTGCASAATGIRAAACRSTCSGRPASCRRASGCPTRASRPIAGAASACPGKVGTGFSEKDMRQPRKLERIPIQPNRDAL